MIQNINIQMTDLGTESVGVSQGGVVSKVPDKYGS
jgi:hypothetical protein